MESVIKKIQKCLALSNSSNEHEAKTALRQAQALMKKHNLSEEEIVLGILAEKITKSKYTGAKQTLSWLPALVSSIAKFCGCYGVVSFTPSRNSNIEKGRISDVYVTWNGSYSSTEIADYYFNFIYREITKGRKDYIEKFKATYSEYRIKKSTITEAGNSHSIGMAITLIEKLRSLISSEDEALFDSIKEHRQKNSNKGMVSWNNDKKLVKSGVAALAARQGLEDAEKIKISKGVTSNQPKPLVLN